jgi:hypothetical protein
MTPLAYFIFIHTLSKSEFKIANTGEGRQCAVPALRAELPAHRQCLPVFGAGSKQIQKTLVWSRAWKDRFQRRRFLAGWRVGPPNGVSNGFRSPEAD